MNLEIATLIAMAITAIAGVALVELASYSKRQEVQHSH